MTHIPSPEQIDLAVSHLRGAQSCLWTGHRDKAAARIQQAATALGYRLLPADAPGAEQSDLVKRLRNSATSYWEGTKAHQTLIEAATALGYTLQPQGQPLPISDREKALVEALEDIALLDEADGHELKVTHAFQAVAIATKTLGKHPSTISAERYAAGAYDPPAVTSEPGAPHDGRSQPRGKDLLLAEEAEFVKGANHE